MAYQTGGGRVPLQRGPGRSAGWHLKPWRRVLEGWEARVTVQKLIRWGAGTHEHGAPPLLRLLLLRREGLPRSEGVQRQQVGPRVSEHRPPRRWQEVLRHLTRPPTGYPRTPPLAV